MWLMIRIPLFSTTILSTIWLSNELELVSMMSLTYVKCTSCSESGNGKRTSCIDELNMFLGFIISANAFSGVTA